MAGMTVPKVTGRAQRGSRNAAAGLSTANGKRATARHKAGKISDERYEQRLITAGIRARKPNLSGAEARSRARKQAKAP